MLEDFVVCGLGSYSTCIFWRLRNDFRYDETAGACIILFVQAGKSDLVTTIFAPRCILLPSLALLEYLPSPYFDADWACAGYYSIAAGVIIPSGCNFLFTAGTAMVYLAGTPVHSLRILRSILSSSRPGRPSLPSPATNTVPAELDMQWRGLPTVTRASPSTFPILPGLFYCCMSTHCTATPSDSGL